MNGPHVNRIKDVSSNLEGIVDELESIWREVPSWNVNSPSMGVIEDGVIDAIRSVRDAIDSLEALV